MNRLSDIRERLLIVDDVPEVLHGIERLLRADGYSIDGAQSEERAVEYALFRPPRLILVNLEGLPNAVMATARRIRNRAKLDAGVPIVLFCAEWMAEGEEVDLGDNVYAIQPDNFDHLRDLLVRLLRC